jgi:hypothetical protein
LAVWVRVARPHHRPTILENLHGVDEGQASEFEVLLGPHVYDPPDVGALHARERQIMTRREADHPRDAALGAGDE